MKKFLYPILLFILIIPTFISLIRVGYFPIQDDQQAFRIFEMDKCFQSHQFPCRWVPDAGYEYGYPQFEYYGPSVYYIGELFHLAGFQFIDSVKILFILGYILGAFGMFIFLKSYLDEKAALVGALLYTYAPYKADEVYVRGDMNEFYALALFPFLFWSVLKLIKTDSKKYIALVGVFTGLLLITHNLMSLIFLPIAGLWGLTLIYLEKDWKLLLKLVPAFLLGVGLAAFFTFPVLLESKYAHLETLLGGYFGFEQHFVSVKQLLFLNYWGYGSSVLGPIDDLSLSTGIIHWMGAGIALALALLNFKKYKKLSIVLFVLFAVELIVLFMMHPRSIVVWNKLTFLAFLQFPWRFLSDSTFLLSVISAAGVFILSKSKGWIYGAFLVLAVIILHISFFQPKAWLNINDAQKFSGSSWNRQLTSSIFDYLPIYAKFPPITPAPALPEVLSGQVNFVSYQKGSDFQIGNINVTKSATLRLPLFDFPGMKVWVDGVEVPHINNNCINEPFCMGLITFQVGEGAHTIKAQLTNTPIRTIGDDVTIVSLLIMIGLLIGSTYEFKKIRS